MRNKCLWKGGTKPPAGWRVFWQVNTMAQSILGDTPTSVINKIKSLEEKNGIQRPIEYYWAKCNHFWLSKRPSSYSTTLRRLEAEIAKYEASFISGIKVEQKKAYFHPDKWGGIAWNSVWFDLNSNETFDQARWISNVNNLIRVINPATNPKFGCVDCYKHFTTNIAKYNWESYTTKENAKKALLEWHNAVNIKNGKPQWTMRQADQQHFGL